MTPSVTENASLIVIDWGTTNRRAHLLDENGTAMTRLNLAYQHIDGAIATINGMWTLWSARDAP